MKRMLLTTDTIIQSIMLCLMIFFPLTLFVSIPLGGWQLGSSLIKGIAWRSKLHFTYFIAATAYCLLLIWGIEHTDSVPFILDYEWLRAMWWVLCLPPLVGAVWYYTQSHRDVKAYDTIYDPKIDIV